MPTEPLVFEDIGDVTLATFAACIVLDGPQVEAAANQLSHLVAERDRRKLILSFRNVQHLNSPALGQLINLHKKFTQMGVGVVIRDLNSQIERFFKGGNDSGQEQSGAGARLIPPKPSGGAAVSLLPPESDD